MNRFMSNGRATIFTVAEGLNIKNGMRMYPDPTRTKWQIIQNTFDTTAVEVNIDIEEMSVTVANRKEMKLDEMKELCEALKFINEKEIEDLLMSHTRPKGVWLGRNLA